VFALQFEWLPVQGYTPLSNGVWPWLQNLILPAVALGSVYTALIARITRASMLEVLQQDYVRTARAKGLDQRSILFIHALEKRAVPIVTVIGIGIALLIGGSIVTESVFAIPAWPADDRRDPAPRLSRDPGHRPAVQLRLRAGQFAGRRHLHAG
jgi:ABC-type dipeptide/oligopeptide/nickel transport systems, permease components